MKIKSLLLMTVVALGLGACSNQAKLDENVGQVNAFGAAINAYYNAQKATVVVEPTK